jgi:hypothetical protein
MVKNHTIQTQIQVRLLCHNIHMDTWVIDMTIYILSAPVLTDWGTYVFWEGSKQEIEEITRQMTWDGFISAVGHEGTAQLLSQILGIPIPTSRISVKMERGDIALVFRVLERLPEGKVLSKEELEKVPYSLGILMKT